MILSLDVEIFDLSIWCTLALCGDPILFELFVFEGACCGKLRPSIRHGWHGLCRDHAPSYIIH